MKVQDILTDESRWTQGTLARGEDGKPCDPNDERAVQFCLRGAIIRAYPRLEARRRAYDAVRRLIGPTLIEYWNDSPERTFGQVRWALEEADV
jgi:hypothetical protein